MRSRRSSFTCRRLHLIPGLPWLTRELPFSTANFKSTAIRALKAKARAQAEEALRLSPTLGEAHMALGLCLYWGDKNYDAALKEFESPRRLLPIMPRSTITLAAFIAGRDAGANRSQASNAPCPSTLATADIACFAGNNHLLVRDWPAATAGYNRALEIAPDSAAPKIGLAYLEVFRNSNPAAGRKILQNIPAGIDPDGSVTLARWDLAMLERDYATAEKILADFPLEDFPRPETPRKHFTRAASLSPAATSNRPSAILPRRGQISKSGCATIPTIQIATLNSDYSTPTCSRKEDAIREGRRAVELEPESKNAFHGALDAANLALVYALVGEPDQAITLIERLLSTPGAATYPDFPSSITLADLRLRWEWDSLRSNPRFQKILAGPEPKTVY